MRSLAGSQILGLAVAAFFSLFSTPASAGQLIVTFDLSGDSFSLAGAAVDISSLGNGTVTGSATVVLTGVNTIGRINNTGQVVGLFRDLDLNVDLNLPMPDATLTGSLNLTQRGQAAFGSYDGRQVSLPTGQISIDLTGSLQCTGAGCGLRAPNGGFPTNLRIPNLFNFTPQLVNVGGLTGTGTLDGMLRLAAMTPNGETVRFTLKGREVSRRFFPEPTETGLLLLGAFALCLYRRSLLKAASEEIVP